MSPSNEAKVLKRNQSEPSIKVSQQKTSKRGYLIAKRTVDILGALTGLIIFFPLFVLLTILIKIESFRAPVFFKQTRIGKDGVEFKMYKFRSMVQNAEELLPQLLDKNEVSGAMFKMKDDPRVTRVGSFIRKTSLDELPQLWNVLKGDMSLVGPRPALPREVNQYNAYHMRRLEVTPGCTGLWQVTARNSVGFEEMIELDLEYIKKRSLLYDIKLMIKTIRVLFGSKNAF